MNSANSKNLLDLSETLLDNGQASLAFQEAEIDENPKVSIQAPLAKPDFSRDEMNLVEFPLAVLSTRVNPKLKTLEFSDSKRLSNGQVIAREWIITGADKFGLPTSTDDDVILALMRLTVEDGFRNRKVYFTRYELLKILRWSTEGRSYRRLTKSLDRLSGVRIKASNSFFSNKDKAYQTRNFGLIDAYEINDGRSKKQKIDPEEKSPKSYFIWSEALFKSFNDGYIKKVDLELYFTLKSAVSRRLYRYLDKHFFYKSVIDRNLMTLAFEKLGVSRNYKYVSSVRQQVEPAIEELMKIGYLSDFDIRGRGSETKVRFVHRSANVSHPVLVHGGKSASPAPASPSEPVKSPTHAALIESISARGISKNIATRLLKARTLSECIHIKNIVRYYDHLVATHDVKVSRNPTGFLYRAVEFPSKFKIPASFGISEKTENRAKRPESRVIGRPTSKAKTEAARDFEGRASASKGVSKPVQTDILADQEPTDEYRDYVDQSIRAAEVNLGSERLQCLEDQVRAKFACMEGVLKPEQIDAAVSGCVRKEIMNLFEIPDFKNWKKNTH